MPLRPDHSLLQPCPATSSLQPTPARQTTWPRAPSRRAGCGPTKCRSSSRVRTLPAARCCAGLVLPGSQPRWAMRMPTRQAVSMAPMPQRLLVPAAPPCSAVTWDDGISPFSYGLVQQIVGGLKQRNGCPVPSTFYICVAGARAVLRCAVLHGSRALSLLAGSRGCAAARRGMWLRGRKQEGGSHDMPLLPTPPCCRRHRAGGGAGAVHGGQ